MNRHLAMEIEDIELGGGELASNSTPIVYDEIEDTLYVGEQGALHDYIYYGRGVNREEMKEQNRTYEGMLDHDSFRIYWYNAPDPARQTQILNEVNNHMPDEYQEPPKLNGWHFGSPNVQNGGHEIKNYLGGGRSFTTVPWQPGNHGKLLLLDGKLHLWSVAGRDAQGQLENHPDPHHDGIYDHVRQRFDNPGDDYNAEQEKSHYADFMTAPKGYINPDGELTSVRQRGAETPLHEIAAMHPALSVPEVSWTFGSVRTAEGEGGGGGEGGGDAPAETSTPGHYHMWYLGPYIYGPGRRRKRRKKKKRKTPRHKRWGDD